MLGWKREEISMIIYDTIFSSDIYLKYLRNQYPSTGSRGKGQMTKERHPPSCLSPDPDSDWTKTQIYRLTRTRKISLGISTNWRERKKERQDCERKKVFESLLAVWEFTRERIGENCFDTISLTTSPVHNLKMDQLWTHESNGVLSEEFKRDHGLSRISLLSFVPFISTTGPRESTKHWGVTNIFGKTGSGVYKEKKY